MPTYVFYISLSNLSDDFEFLLACILYLSTKFIERFRIFIFFSKSIERLGIFIFTHMFCISLSNLSEDFEFLNFTLLSLSKVFEFLFSRLNLSHLELGIFKFSFTRLFFLNLSKFISNFYLFSESIEILGIFIFTLAFYISLFKFIPETFGQTSNLNIFVYARLS